jgi:hypothetical protein
MASSPLRLIPRCKAQLHHLNRCPLAFTPLSMLRLLVSIASTTSQDFRGISLLVRSLLSSYWQFFLVPFVLLGSGPW